MYLDGGYLGVDGGWKFNHLKLTSLCGALLSGLGAGKVRLGEGEMDKMQNLVAIVTGASRGLGRAIALEYAQQGARVVICARSQSPTGFLLGHSTQINAAVPPIRPDQLHPQ